jgi:hypothetical protein
MTLRIYLRRSKNDEGNQFRLDVQHEGGQDFSFQPAVVNKHDQ